VTLTVETGSGILGADSYVAAVDCLAYATARGLTFGSDATAEAALRRATAYIDNTYRLRFSGYRTFRRAQSLEWPRSLSFYFTPDYGGHNPYFVDPRAIYPFDLIPPNVIPPEIITATCEAAIREFATPGALLPDLDRGGAVASLKAGPVEVKYAPGADPNTLFQVIDAALSALIGVKSAYTSRAARR